MNGLAERLDVINPATEEILDVIPLATAADVDVAVDRARDAFPAWAATPLPERLGYLAALADELERRTDDLTALITGEVGTPLSECRSAQVGLPIAVLRDTVEVAAAHPWRERCGRSEVWREPAGVVGAITPWNFPLHQIVAKMGPALAAGCTFVLKPSEVAPLNALVLFDALKAVGVPPGVANLVLGTLAGYSLARLRFRGQNALLGVYLGSRMVPGIALIVPLYLTLKNLGMLDHLSALITTYVTFTLPFTIWLLKNYFQTIPRSLEEAAFMDGCSWLQMLVKVLLPVAMPGLVSAAMFAFMTAWNDYLFAVILTSTTASKTLPVVVAGFATDVTTQRTLMATGGVLAIIPPLALAFLFQRLIVQGLTSGAVKD